MLKKRNVHGFTLVELIVVIAIIGVLAGILVPAMVGYVSKAKFSANNSSAKNLLNAGMLACRQTDVIKPIPVGIYVAEDDPLVSAGGNIYQDATINKYLYEYFDQAHGLPWAIMIEDDVVTGACIAKNANDMFIGTYPNPNTTKGSLTEKGYAAALAFARDGSWS